jgi:hypothetical protein
MKFKLFYKKELLKKKPKHRYEIGDLLLYQTEGITNLPDGLGRNYRIFMGFCLGNEGIESYRWIYPDNAQQKYISSLDSLTDWQVVAQHGLVNIYKQEIHLRDCYIISKTGKLISDYFFVNYTKDSIQAKTVDFVVGKNFWQALKLGWEVFRTTLRNQKEYNARDLSCMGIKT